jgi:predicted nucleic acid-binding protein
LKVFVDTSGFVARYNSKDEHHDETMDYLQRIESGEADVRKLYTSDYVIDETITTIFARTTSFEVAKKCGEAIITSKAIERLPIDEQTFRQAWEFFKARGEIGLSFTDATSIVLIRKKGIDTVFTFDSHFAKMGSPMVP